MRFVLVSISAAAMAACSVLVDTSGLTGGAHDAGAVVDSSGARDATTTTDAPGPNAEAGAADAALDVDASLPTCGVLPSGTEFHVEDKVTSCNEKYYLIFQSDGNICLYGGNVDGAIWATGTYDKAVDHAVMQTNGDFVVLNGNGKTVYSTGTSAFPGAYLSVTDDGFVTITSGGVVRWRGQNY